MKGELGSAALDYSVSESFKGWGVGAGIKTMLTNNVYLKAEVLRIDYKSKSYGVGSGMELDIKPAATIGTIGIGMNF